MAEHAAPVEPMISQAEERRTLKRGLRARRPRVLRAVSSDAAVYCAHRREVWPASRLGRLFTAIRLCWQADAFLALACYRLRTTLLDAPIPVPVLPKLLHFLSGQLSGIRIGDWVSLEEGVYVPHGQIVLDGLVKIGRGSVLCPWISIGLLQGDVHGPTLEEGVFVGTGARILGKWRIGAYAKIGANAVIVSDVPPGATAVGVPARVIETDRSDATSPEG